MTHLKLLENLIADGSVAPNVSGYIFYKKPNQTIASPTEFEKLLKRYQIVLKGKITVLQFWEKKCKYCKLLLPKLEKNYEKYKNKGVQFFAVNTNDFGAKNDLIDFLNSYSTTKSTFDPATNMYYEKKDAKYYKPFNIPIIFAEKTLKKRYGVTAFPAVIVINKKGIVHTAMVGYFEEYDKWMSELLDDMLKNK
ncbi:Thiol-disulfide oxidoreductase ResA [bioreactor metagenome]|uniref:Thiol-disulfide oxidoreductase ResA n=1 Tax=bioreactor metagenome TaxID=1076179 RepID=A0A645DIY6_9ZZZZ